MSLSKFSRVRPLACLLTGMAALAFAHPASAAVKAGDTFTFSIAGFNSSSGAGYILGSGLSTVFGESTTFDSVGYNGQSYTISSWEVVGATTTTDHFRITTPVSFLTSTSVNGTSITALQFDIGTANSGVGVSTGADAVDFSSPIVSYTSAGSMVYGVSNTKFTLTPSVSLASNKLSFTVAEGVNTGTSAISGFAIHEFNYSITYANPVPEPETYAMMLAGLGLVGAIARRRQKRG